MSFEEVIEEDVTEESDRLTGLWFDKILPLLNYFDDKERDILAGKVSKEVIAKFKELKSQLKEYEDSIKALNDTIEESKEAGLDAINESIAKIWSSISGRNITQGKWVKKFEELIY